LARGGLALRIGDVLVFAQKVDLQSGGPTHRLATVVPSAAALELARTVAKGSPARRTGAARIAARSALRPDVLIVEHRLGLIMANAGIDQSNVADPAGGEFALLLPEDPDASAARLP